MMRKTKAVGVVLGVVSVVSVALLSGLGCSGDQPESSWPDAVADVGADASGGQRDGMVSDGGGESDDVSTDVRADGVAHDVTQDVSTEATDAVSDAVSDGAKDVGADGPSGGTCPTGWICPKKPIHTARIGAWYANIWKQGDSTPEAFGWNLSRYRPEIGHYESSDPAIIDKHLEQMKKAGIDYLILDGTNGYSTTLAKNTELLIHRQMKLPKDKRMPVAFALGANIWASGALPEAQAVANHQAEVNTMVQDFAANAGTQFKYDTALNGDPVSEPIKNLYFQWQGRPLMVYYTAFAPGYKALDWDDARLSVRRATGIVNPNDAFMKTYGELGWWGWVLEYPQILSDDGIGVTPGADNKHRGCDGCTYSLAREKGELFIREWVRAITHNPKTIIISSWNCFVDETAIEPAVPVAGGAPAYTDTYDEQVPDWYVQIVTGYANMRIGLMDGYCYRDEDAVPVYQVVNSKLVHLSEFPHRRPVLQTPKGTLAALLKSEP